MMRIISEGEEWLQSSIVTAIHPLPLSRRKPLQHGYLPNRPLAPPPPTPRRCTSPYGVAAAPRTGEERRGGYPASLPPRPRQHPGTPQPIHGCSPHSAAAAASAFAADRRRQLYLANPAAQRPVKPPSPPPPLPPPPKRSELDGAAARVRVVVGATPPPLSCHIRS